MVRLRGAGTSGARTSSTVVLARHRDAKAPLLVRRLGILGVDGYGSQSEGRAKGERQGGAKVGDDLGHRDLL